MSTRSNPNAFVPALPSMGHHRYPSGYLERDLRQLTSTGLYLSDQLSNDDEDDDDDSWDGGEGDTPTPKVVPNQWSDVTLTGRSSFCSWEDEGVLDRIAGEAVGRIFDAIDRALYDGCPTGQEHVDRECKEWNTNFPHFRITGVHLLDSLEDGTEIVDPIITTDDQSTIDSIQRDKLTALAISGRGLSPLAPPPCTTGSPPNDNPGLHYEEIIASDGVMEEYFAYSTDSKEGIDLKRVSRRHRSHHLPPVTPTECIRDTVFSIVFDQVWSEIASVLQPLLLKYKSLQSDHDSFSEENLLAPGHLPVLYIPSKGELAPPTRQGQLQSLRKKPPVPSLIGPAPVSHITTDLPSLQNVMTIKAVPLQQRLPSSSNTFFTTSGTGSMLFHEALLSSRGPPNIRNIQTPLPHRNADQKIISGKPGNRRNTLKPLEIPRTPGLPPMLDEEFSGLIGQRLVRHTQLPPLPPLDKPHPDKSPHLPRSSGVKGRVTFSNRIVSAVAENNELSGRNNQRQLATLNHSDPRPNTTQTFRSEAAPLVKRPSNHTPSPIKIIGHAASLHNDLILWEEQEDGPQDNQPLYMFTSPKPKSGLPRSKLASRSQIK